MEGPSPVAQRVSVNQTGTDASWDQSVRRLENELDVTDSSAVNGKLARNYMEKSVDRSHEPIVS